jgi:hypothetical protein
MLVIEQSDSYSDAVMEIKLLLPWSQETLIGTLPEPANLSLQPIPLIAYNLNI